ncbi:YbfA family protein [Photorhabdus heterorhabditis]|uniref:YbfA family protein n=1 Tax=Photorhabdus heterorhabditis TaxID=880156 RepID=UPI001BD5F627|nr:YbfA family protein [Photorhabdus heterorhabditis]MBS9443091.1 DUF2517 family protein [Photorhabdus heterorhabditis]
MSVYRKYPWHQVLLRRISAVTLGVLALPIMLFRRDRTRFYSYLYRVWIKTSDKPVWLAQSELVITVRNN